LEHHRGLCRLYRGRHREARPHFAREVLPALKDRVEREYLLHHLRRFKGDARALSSFLGYSRKYLYRRLKALGIRLKEERRRG
jgi:DNA-binding NtrC family response regulator